MDVKKEQGHDKSFCTLLMMVAVPKHIFESFVLIIARCTQKVKGREIEDETSFIMDERQTVRCACREKAALKLPPDFTSGNRNGFDRLCFLGNR